MQDRPLILVTNDDGITAPGIRMLIEIMNKIGDVVVVAPDSPQSGMGHAITVNNVLHCNPITIDEGPQIEYSCSGTPADCVKMAKNEILNRTPDLCVSGINHGSNSSINVIYSGTMSAAVEAGIEGIPAIGFSLLDFDWHADFRAARKFIEKIALNVLLNGLPDGVILNVNIPKLKEDEIKGVRICRQANGYWKETFDKRKSPFGKEYYWLSGEFINRDKGQDTDIWALENGFISVVPVQFDMTAHHAIQKVTYMGHIKKEILIGVIVSLLATTCGFFVYLEYISELSISETISKIREGGVLGSVIALAAIPNLFVFLGVFKEKQDYRARGVLITTIAVALLTAYLKFF